MTKVIRDDVFGDMRYDHAWEKTEEITAFGKTYDVKVVAEAYSEDIITDVQRAAYETYKHNIQTYLISVPDVLLKYYIDNYESISSNIDIPERINHKNINKELIVKLIKIRTIYFDRKGRFGWLCDCAWDNEHGICVVLTDKAKIIVSEQDYLL